MTQLFGIGLPTYNPDRKFETGDIVVYWHETIPLKRVPVLCKIVRDIPSSKIYFIEKYLDVDERYSFNQGTVYYGSPWLVPFQEFVDKEVETLEKYREDLLKLSDKVYQEANK